MSDSNLRYSEMPPKLQELIELLQPMERGDRIQFLIDVAERYRPVRPEIATPPYPDEHKVPACESEAYVWAQPRDDGTLSFHFAVLNPQGISAMAMAAILDDTASGAPLEQVASIEGDVIYDIFGRELSMGKSMGLCSLVGMVQTYAKRRAKASRPRDLGEAD